MVKQRQPPPRPAKAQSQSHSSRPVRGSEPEAAVPRLQTPGGAQAAAAPQRRSTYFEAVALYERGLEALQRHDYGEAANLFESVLRQYPEEKELHERVRLYLNICQRH